MSEFDIAFRVRTQSSYQISLGSSRSSKFLSGQSLCLDDQDISLQIGQLCQIRHCESLNPQNFINSKTEYIIEFDYEDDKVAQQKQEENKKKQPSNSAPSNHYKRQNHYSIPQSIQKLFTSHKRCPHIATSQILNVAYGAMFGFVIGDSIGSHLIHKNRYINDFITNALQMKGGGIFNLYPGQGTDQTEISLTLSSALLQCSAQKQQSYNKQTIAKKYLQWMQSKPFDYPTLVAISFSQIKKQTIKNQGIFKIDQISNDLQKGSLKNKKHESSVALIKMIPLTLWSSNLSDQEFIQLIKEEMKFFIPNEFAIQVCIVYGKVLRKMLKTGDHQYSIHQVAKWIYSHGSQKLIDLWRLCQNGKQIQINSFNMNSISVPFLYALNQINKRQINFIDSLIKILLQGHNTDTNCSIVMGLVGAAIGFNRIPNYFKTKVIQCRIEKSLKPRYSQLCPSKIVQIVPELIQKGPTKLKIT